MLAFIAQTMSLVIAPLPAQAHSAKLVLIPMFIGLETPRLFITPSRGGGRPVNKRATSPYPSKPGARRPDVVIHLPARSQTVALIDGAHGFNHFPFYRIAEIGKAVERL